MIPRFIIIHHTATPLSTTFSSINNGHRRKWNWRSSLGYYIGYQYFITASGTTIQGRADNEDGAHTKGWNDKSIGIALAGNFMFETMTTSQIQSLEKLLTRLKKKWGISNDNIFGHREKGFTLCPGNKLMGWIKEYRKKIEIITPPDNKPNNNERIRVLAQEIINLT